MWGDDNYGQAEARVAAFKDVGLSKILNISQAGTMGDKMDQLFKDGDQCEWHIRCANCDHQQMPVWTGKRADGSRWGIVWDEIKDENGHWKINDYSERVAQEVLQNANLKISISFGDLKVDK